MAAGCSSAGNDAATEPQRPSARITAAPAVDATNVSVRTPVTITVADGTLTRVTVTNAEGQALAGSISSDQLTWTSSEPLGFGGTYTYAATAVGA